MLSAAILGVTALASAGAVALGIQEAVVPLAVAVITGGPAWLQVRKGQADVTSRLARLEKGLEKLDEGLTAHRDYHLWAWPGRPVAEEALGDEEE